MGFYTITCFPAIWRVFAAFLMGDNQNASMLDAGHFFYLDFQPLSALCEALGSVLLPCGLWGLTLFHLSSFIFVSSDDADRSLKLASAAVVRCQPWIYLRLMA